MAESGNLTTLRDAGLATAERAGRRLLYQRTRLGDQLADGDGTEYPSVRAL
jgi:hypothetical protein